MVYYKIILNDKRHKEDQIYPIVIRITSNRVATTISTGVRININHWDKVSSTIKKSQPNWQLLNKQLLEFYNKVQNAVIKLEEEGMFSFDALRSKLEEKRSKSLISSSFNEYVEEVINELKEFNKSGNALIYQTAWNRLSNFTDNKKLKFTDINYTLLERFKRQLILDGVKVNTISNYFRTLRAIYNKAIKAKIVDASSYPFNDVVIKSERTLKRAIPISDLAQVRSLNLPFRSPSWHSRNYFILSFSLIGISFTDLVYLRPSNIQGDRLIYKRRKTHKQYSIKLSSTARSIIDLYRGRNSKYLLPILPSDVVEDSITAHKLIKQFIKTTNKYLKRMANDLNIDPITTYVARHTWATTAKRLGYSNELIAEALGHEYGNKITNIYLDSFEPSAIDDVNVKVLEALE